MHRETAGKIATGVLVGTLALGGIGYAYGADDVTSTDSTETASVSGVMRRAGGGLAKIVAELTGLDVGDVMDRRSDGESFADIAESEGVSSDAVKSAAIESYTDRLDDELASTDALPAHGGGRGGPGGHGMGSAPPEAVLAELADLEMSEILDRRENGESLSAIAKAEGIDITDVIDKVIADAEEWLTERVDAGDMTAEEKTERLTEMRERLTEMVESTDAPAMGGHGPGRMGEQGDASDDE